MNTITVADGATIYYKDWGPKNRQPLVFHHYAADAAAVVAHLDLRDAIHIGHSTGGGEATHYVAAHGKGRVAKLVLISAVPPIMVRTPANPGGLPIEVFDDLRRQLAANRAQFYRDFASGPSTATTGRERRCPRG
jgi:non-heme chloroperoxidase